MIGYMNVGQKNDVYRSFTETFQKLTEKNDDLCLCILLVMSLLLMAKKKKKSVIGYLRLVIEMSLNH